MPHLFRRHRHANPLPIMYVCLCNAVTERQIRDVVERGARSLDEVQRCLPVATCCGCCEDTAREVITDRNTVTPAIA
jgi:bacterioferritin-associated ferredoxin